MPEDPELSFVLCIVAGALAVAAGAFGALSLAPSASALLAVFATLRICWLDDNIANDLLDRDQLPPSYINAQRRQRWLESLLLGRSKTEETPTPAQVATRMRAEVQVWSAIVVAGVAAMLARTTPFGMLVSFGLALWAFLWAFRFADRLSATLWLVETGRVLPREDLLRRVSWAYSGRNDRDR
ncbi:MAG: hypothetical protein ACU0CC_11935 [Sagittula sp.]|uniref:hypothetical protein n=1 Tax=Sagittula sp. TaxID=2038081 RepID=UPI0040591B11